MKPSLLKSGTRSQAEDPQGSAGLKVVRPTVEHIALLAEIQSPWIQVFGSREKPLRTLQGALRSVTPEQIAEMMFVMSRPVSESRALLAKGRSDFTKEAMSAVAREISEDGLKALAADGGRLIVGATARSLPLKG